MNAFIKEFSKLNGKTVRDVVSDGGQSGPCGLNEGEECFGLQFTDGTIAWIMRDPEGNGPGFLDIQNQDSKRP